MARDFEPYRNNGAALRDDWFVFRFDHDHRACPRPGVCNPIKTEIHELCVASCCAYHDGPCEFHPAGCECSDGACQE